MAKKKKDVKKRYVELKTASHETGEKVITYINRGKQRKKEKPKGYSPQKGDMINRGKFGTKQQKRVE